MVILDIIGYWCLSSSNRSYFSPEGISYAFGRVPIGGCDFSTRAYTYDDIPNDKKLEKFNLTTEDFQYKIPLIQQANRLRGEPLRLVGSAWSAPAWMKTNNALTGRGELKTQYYQTWAQYLIMFLDFYKREQLSFWALTTGNEPINGDLPSFLPFVPKFNSMGWHPKSVATWIANNLGPTLRSSQHNATKILAIDDQRFVLPWWLEQVCNIGLRMFQDKLPIPEKILRKDIPSMNVVERKYLFKLYILVYTAFAGIKGLFSPILEG
ncbi:glucosylceramidase-like [Diaphorina citri]|uniref:Glucosylceramidase n=1 Tax=Diaphorina citri TaxID=121845 RepID=A0A3Q0JJ39_DIACI|nr:glucosylceramidase-like [Diaphorina citri]